MDKTSIKLWNGDYLDKIHLIPDKSIRLGLFDMPYGVTSNKIDKKIDLARMWQEIDRVMMPNGTIACYCQGLFFVDLVNSNRKHFKYDIVWNKVLTGHPLNANKMPLRVHEQIAIFYKKPGIYNPQFTKGKPQHSRGIAYLEKEQNARNTGKVGNIPDTRKGNELKHPTSIIKYRKPHPSVALHPTEKSVDCNEWIIKTYSNEGDTVLDITCGSGTTGLACINVNRSAILIEKDPDQYNLAKNNLRNKIYFGDLSWDT